ncbi:oligosaccharide repeat unit polymerase [Cyanobacteria bacterium FACHB-DQ100]|nr:oligosaccharide repeat unit polymerase [Cyanobacteria bacterium FACHB-DQ100]
MSLSRDFSEDIYPEVEHFPPSASGAATLAILGGVALGFIGMQSPSDQPALIARAAAIPVAIGLTTSIYLDSRRGLRNLFRTDLLCLISLYYLILAEFLFPQEEFNTMIDIAQTRNAIAIVLVAFAAFAIGRHLIKPQAMQSSWLNFEDVSTNTLFRVVMISAILGYLYMLQSVQFDIIKMINAMMGARFSEPWTRARLGGASSLIIELGLLRYAIPPLFGVLCNRRHLIPLYQQSLLVAAFALTMFQGFSGGTRNVFVAYLATFIVGYLLTLPRYTFINTIIPVALTFSIAAYGSYHMLEFRTIGLRNYLENRVYASDTVRQTLSVDYNLASLGIVADAIPSAHNYLGSEILVWSIIKPIPRVFLPSKPEGLSVSLEEIAGVEGYTIATTYIGEAYMMAGYWGVIATSLFLGALANWWNRLVLQRQSDYAMVVYALGFFAGSITMRSLFWLTTAILPVIGLIVARKSGLIR